MYADAIFVFVGTCFEFRFLCIVFTAVAKNFEFCCLLSFAFGYHLNFEFCQLISCFFGNQLNGTLFFCFITFPLFCCFAFGF